MNSFLGVLMVETHRKYSLKEFNFITSKTTIVIIAKKFEQW